MHSTFANSETPLWQHKVARLTHKLRAITTIVRQPLPRIRLPLPFCILAICWLPRLFSDLLL